MAGASSAGAAGSAGAGAGAGTSRSSSPSTGGGGSTPSGASPGQSSPSSSGPGTTQGASPAGQTRDASPTSESPASPTSTNDQATVSQEATETETEVTEEVSSLIDSLESTYADAAAEEPAAEEAAADPATAPADPSAAPADPAAPQGYTDQLGGVLAVHGLGGDRSSLQGITDHLTSGGVNQFGGVIEGERLGDLTPERIAEMSPEDLRSHLGLNPEGNVFAMEFAQNDAPMADNAQQLSTAVDVVSRLTGDEGIDLVAHSKGGLDSRAYLNNPNEKVDNLITLGTPHGGSSTADWGDTMVGRQMASLLGMDGAGGLGELSPSSPALADLNANTQGQLDAANITAINAPGPGGDTTVDPSAAHLPGANNLSLWSDNAPHTGLDENVAMQHLVGDVLAGRGPSGPNIFDGDAGRLAFENATTPQEDTFTFASLLGS